MAERRANCTHISMVILHGPYHCSICNRQGGFGAVYRCSQDLPEAVSSLLSRENEVARLDYIVRNGTPAKSAIFEPLSLSSKSPIAGGQPKFDSIRSITENLYSEKQKEQLRLQKLNVQIIVNESRRRLQHLNTSLEPLLVNSIIASSPKTTLEKISQDITSVRHADSRDEPHTENAYKERQATSPICRMKICHNCRLNYIERAWGRIDAVALLDPHILLSGIPSQPSLLSQHVDNSSEGVSPAQVVRNIGLRQSPQRPVLALDSDLEISSSSSSQLSASSSDSTRPQLGFRQNVSRAFRSFITNRQRPGGPSRRPRSLYKADGASSFVHEEGSERGENSVVETPDADIASRRKSGVDEGRQLAVALPSMRIRHRNRSKGFGSGEVVLDDGIAVTEEAVGENVADLSII